MNLWLYDKLKAIWRHNTVANENNGKIHCEDVQNDAPKFLKIRIFWRSFWLQTALKNFQRIFSSRYEYVKCCPRSYLSSALWIMVIQRTNPFLFGKVLTPPVTLDLGAASLIIWLLSLNRKKGDSESFPWGVQMKYQLDIKVVGAILSRERGVK